MRQKDQEDSLDYIKDSVSFPTPRRVKIEKLKQALSNN
jgi:hypothetical protein